MNEDSKNENKHDVTGVGAPYGFPGESPEKTGFEATDPVDNVEPAGPSAVVEPIPGFLELVYGVLFEPGKTMLKVAEKPPLGMAILVVTILSLLGTVMGFLTVSRALNQGFHAAAMDQYLPAVRILVPLGAVFGLLWGYLKWFGYSAILHLAAELLGGRGNARGVFAAAGLAGLPSIFMIPIQFLAYWFGTGNLAVTVLVWLAWLAVGIWILILLVIGLRQVHGLSTGHSVLVVLSPVLALMVLGILMILVLVAAVALIPASMNFPGYF